MVERPVFAQNHCIMGILVLGEVIKNRRKGLGITQTDLDELSGVGKNTICKLERGESNPSWEVVGRLLDILGMELRVEVKMMPLGCWLQRPILRRLVR